MSRPWVKLYVEQCLRGSLIAELTPAQRWIWIGLILLGGDSSIPGVIFRRKDAEGGLLGYSSVTLTEMLDVDLEDYQDGTQRMISKGKISINSAGVIAILNWSKYQSEYERQKTYRNRRKKSNMESCNQSDTLDGEFERDREIEGEDKDQAESPLPYIKDHLLPLLKELARGTAYPLSDSDDIAMFSTAFKNWPNTNIAAELEKKFYDWKSPHPKSAMNPSAARKQLLAWFRAEEEFQRKQRGFT
jgi:hypothetical protein